MCRGCTGINIGESFFFFRILGNKAILLGRLDSGHIVNFHCFVQQRVVPLNYYYLYIF